MLLSIRWLLGKHFVHCMMFSNYWLSFLLRCLCSTAHCLNCAEIFIMAYVLGFISNVSMITWLSWVFSCAFSNNVKISGLQFVIFFFSISHQFFFMVKERGSSSITLICVLSLPSRIYIKFQNGKTNTKMKYQNSEY